MEMCCLLNKPIVYIYLDLELTWLTWYMPHMDAEIIIHLVAEDLLVY